MKVIVKNKDNSIHLHSVNPGDCFRLRESTNEHRFLRARLDTTSHLKWRAGTEVDSRVAVVNLETGELKCLVANVKVVLVTAQVICDD